LFSKDLPAAQYPGIRSDPNQVLFHGELEFGLVLLEVDDLGKVLDFGQSRLQRSLRDAFGGSLSFEIRKPCLETFFLLGEGRGGGDQNAQKGDQQKPNLFGH